MVDTETLHRSLAAAGSTLVAFVGLAHEFVGATLFPWAPALFGGPIGWHAVGLATTLAGVLLLLGTLRVIRVPMLPTCIAISALGAAAMLYAAIVHGQFHFFALSASLAATVVAVCYRRAEHRPAA